MGCTSSHEGLQGNSIVIQAIKHGDLITRHKRVNSVKFKERDLLWSAGSIQNSRINYFNVSGITEGELAQDKFMHQVMKCFMQIEFNMVRNCLNDNM